jgi:hypothetical protein
LFRPLFSLPIRRTCEAGSNAFERLNNPEEIAPWSLPTLIPDRRAHRTPA